MNLPDLFVLQKSDRVIKMFIFADAIRISQIVKKDNQSFLIVDEHSMIDALIKYLKSSGKFEELLSEFLKTSYECGEDWIVKNKRLIK